LLFGEFEVDVMAGVASYHSQHETSGGSADNQANGVAHRARWIGIHARLKGVGNANGVDGHLRPLGDEFTYPVRRGPDASKDSEAEWPELASGESAVGGVCRGQIIAIERLVLRIAPTLLTIGATGSWSQAFEQPAEPRRLVGQRRIGSAEESRDADGVTGKERVVPRREVFVGFVVLKEGLEAASGVESRLLKCLRPKSFDVGRAQVSDHVRGGRS